MLKLLDLFSGIGGFSLGLERTGGFETVAFCEIDKFCQKVLRKHWPNVRQYTDIKTLTAAQLTADGITVDAICGGFPCQDISLAGGGQEWAKAHAADYGASTPVLLASYDHATQSWRTSQHCLVEGLEVFSETWPRSGMTRNGIAYQRQPLAPLSSEIGSGSWPTPRAAKRGARSFVTALEKLKRDGRTRHHRLEDALVCAEQTNGIPNPAFVEWLMGFPQTWTELALSGTQSSPKSRNSLGEQS